MVDCTTKIPGLFQGDFISGTTTDDTHALLKGTLDTALMSGESLHIHDNNGNLVGIAQSQAQLGLYLYR